MTEDEIRRELIEALREVDGPVCLVWEGSGERIPLGREFYRRVFSPNPAFYPSGPAIARQYTNR